MLGLTGSIAAYKSATLARELQRRGAEIRVVMTKGATEFITPLTMATLVDRPVHSDFTEDEDAGTWTNHVELGLWGDLILVAPATANTLAAMVHGQCDNLLQAVLLSARCPVSVAPAMDLDMYQHASTQSNLNVLMQRGVDVIDPGTGALASGLVGKGRMAEPEDILAFIEADVLSKLPLKGKKVLITAGPTYEAIDPVRFIGNHSSGKMGFEIAKAAANLGAEVTLVTGPTHQSMSLSLVDVKPVVSAQDMYDQVHKYYQYTDVAILSAAVADYRPKQVAEQKIKKVDSTLTVELEKTKDILKSLGQEKTNQFLVGFALETNNELLHAKAKLEAKKLDLIVLNSLRDKGAGFGVSTNKVTFITKSNQVIENELKSKAEVAKDLMQLILKQIDA